MSMFQELAEAWSCPFVARGEVGKFSGGLLHPRSLANLDSLGKGPKGRVRLGQKVAYRTEDLIAWMEDRGEQL